MRIFLIFLCLVTGVFCLGCEQNEKGVDLHLKISEERMIPAQIMYEAILDGNEEKFLQAMDDGANVNALWYKGSFISFAIENGHPNLARRLIYAGANVNKCDPADRTPLRLAVCSRDYWLSKLLLVAGADPNLVCASSALSALDFAEMIASEEDEHLAIAKMLRESVINSDIRNLISLEALYRDGSNLDEILEGADDRVIVGVIDSGVSYLNSALANRIVKPKENIVPIVDELVQKYFSESSEEKRHQEKACLIRAINDGYQGIFDYDGLDNDEDLDYIRHGTYVSNILLHEVDEIAILPIKALGNDYSGDEFSLLASIEVAIMQGAKIINLSWDVRDSSSFCGIKVDDFCLDVGEHKLKKLIQSFPDVLFVIAVPNEGKDLDNTTSWWKKLNLPNAIVVAGSYMNGIIVETSSYGKKSIDLVAFGFMEVSSRLIQGNSMAAPQVTRIAAQMKYINPDLSPAEIKKIICDSVNKIDELKKKTRCGGFLSISKSLKEVRRTAFEKEEL